MPDLERKPVSATETNKGPGDGLNEILDKQNSVPLSRLGIDSFAFINELLSRIKTYLESAKKKE